MRLIWTAASRAFVFVIHAVMVALMVAEMKTPVGLGNREAIWRAFWVNIFESSWSVLKKQRMGGTRLEKIWDSDGRLARALRLATGIWACRNDFIYQETSITTYSPRVDTTSTYLGTSSSMPTSVHVRVPT